MDVWIVAAAAGAGYVAQRLKNLTRGNHNFITNGSSRSIEKVQGKSCPLRRISSRKSFVGEMYTEKEQVSEDAEEMASTSGFEGENLVMLENFSSCSTVSNSNPVSSFSKEEDVQGYCGSRVPLYIDEVDTSDSLPQPSSRDMGFSYGYRRNRSSLRSRRINSQFIKPRTSLESCLMAQLYKEHAEIEEYTYSVRPPHIPIVRPYIVTDGSRIISREPHESFIEPNGTLGVPRLPNVISLELQKKAKAETGKRSLRINSTRGVDQNHNYAEGSSDGAFLFYLGLTTGIISSFLANKREMETLNKSLKQTESLVQDLQEELEMKDSLTVKELAVEGYEPHELHNASYSDDAVNAFSLEHELDDSSRYSNVKCCDRRASEESMSKIEAELEVELERLESNINSSKLEGKLSNIAELHPNFASDVIMGDLRADLFGAKTDTHPYANRDGSGSSTPNTLRYPVSPRELSLRLHEVIQSRLEERIKELETVLENSQRNVEQTESIEHISMPYAQEDSPVVINLSGEALAAYNEAYEEFTKVSDSDEEEEEEEEEDFPFGFDKSNHQEIFHQCKQVIDRVQNGGVNGYVDPILNGNREMSNMVVCTSRDESEDGEDEMEKLLIKQIVEKVKQGSPAVLNAQRALL